MLRQRTVIGQQYEAGTIQVQTPHWMNTASHLGDERRHRLPTMRIRQGCQNPLGLVKHPITRRFRANFLPINANDIHRQINRTTNLGGLTIHAHPPGPDQFLAGAT